MRSLFLKIFLWFWSTAIMTGIALVLTFVLEHGSVPTQWHNMLAEAARFSGTTAVQTFEQAGSPGAAAYLEKSRISSGVSACLFDEQGHPLAGKACASFEDVSARLVSSHRTDFSFKYGLVRVGMLLQGPSGHTYVFATELPAGPRAAAVGIHGPTMALRWGVALLVSGFICYLLTRYITKPVMQQRAASHHLARGEFNTRAAANMELRNDELGGLVRDFNSMADRIEELIAGQRQLLYDVSHQVRSPLARLNVALDLARERKGDDPAFEHMEQDLKLLDVTVERLLTVARLETSVGAIAMTKVNLTKLVSRVVDDAHFESRVKDRSIELATDAECRVLGNSELLHSAIENVIRNALRYSPDGSTVQVLLKRTGETAPEVLITVRDFGPGVPENELKSIFRPFYRIADARDRESGGSGLGLAIADRVIGLHKGKIWAENANDGGLFVCIVLPLTQ